MNPRIPVEEALIQLKKIWSTDEFKFVAKYQESQDNKGGFFTELKANDREIFYPRSNSEELKYSRKINVFVPGSVDLQHDKHYLIEVALEEDKYRGKNPYKLKLVGLFEIENYFTPKEFIQKRFFEKGQSPSDAITIASQLSLNELELYTQTKRFIFELIQNADDMPREGRPVNIEIYLTKNHLLFLHDGKFFDREDVEAICDAARSNKKQNATQTGYKGIGFKSVFTDSSRVYIRSGDYSFKFDKEAEVYKDFWKLYDGLIRKFNPDALKEFRSQYSGQEDEYLKIENIPWQIKPIWLEKYDYPQELQDSPFINSKYQVAIALEVGDIIINDKEKDYHKMITQLINEPRFLLFLRNVTGLHYQRVNGVGSTPTKINIKKKSSSIEVENNNKLLAGYLKRDFYITLNNDDFQKTGLDFTKIERKDKTVFVNSDGKQLDNIPEKLVKISETTLSYAAKIDDSKILSLSSENSILFNYLPTSDNRFGFHFLVNADFVCKTDREFIQIENKWNHYIFFKIGYNLIRWLAKIIEEHNKPKFKYASSYLNLLPKYLLDGDNQERGGINKSFNNGITEGIKDISFILASDGSLKKANEIIVDKTGLTKILKGKGIGFLKFATNTSKEFNHFRIEEHQLNAEYLKIEKIRNSDLIDILSKEINRELFRSTLKNLENSAYQNFISWLNKFFSSADAIEKLGKDLPFVKIENQVYSINECHKMPEIFLKTKKVKNIELSLNKIGCLLPDFYLDDHHQILSIVKSDDTYVNNDFILFKLISSNSNLGKLSANEKSILLSFLGGLDQVGSDKIFNELRLFRTNKSQELFPLSNLISNTESDLPNWFNDLFICRDEENTLKDIFLKRLQTKNTLFKNILCKSELFKNVSEQVLKAEEFEQFYKYVLNLYQAQIDDGNDGYSDIPWIYCPKEKKFLISSEIYCPDSLRKINNIGNFYDIKDKIESISELKLPIFCSLELIGRFKLGCISGSIQLYITKQQTFDERSVHAFLDWLELNNEEDFLKKFNFDKVNKTYNLKFQNTLPYYFTKSAPLISYIEANNLLPNHKLFPTELYSKSSGKLGLLQSEELANILIDGGANKLDFSIFIYGSQFDNLKTKYVESVEKIEIHTDNVYDKQSDLYRFFKLVDDLSIKLEEKSDQFLEIVRSKILLDGQKLSSKAVSEDIFFPGKGESKAVSLGVKLSDVLKKYKNNSFSINLIVNAFPGSSASLIKKVFRVSRISPDVIFEEIIRQNSTRYDSNQTYFLIRYKDHFGEQHVFKLNKHFGVLKYLVNQTEYLKEAINFLDLCYRDNYTHSFAFLILGESINDMIFHAEFALPNEKLPQWILDWCNNEKSKIEFLYQCGLNNDESPVVLLRSGLIRNNPDLIGRGRENLQNPLLLKNTLLWLFQKQGNIKVSLKREYLSPVYQKLQRANISVSELPIPVIKMIGSGDYDLKLNDENLDVHRYNSSWGIWSNDIFRELVSHGKSVVDDTIGDGYLENLNVQNIQLYDGFDLAQLKASSMEVSFDWYIEWSQKHKHAIYLFEGRRLPKIISYSTFFIKRYEGETVANIENQFYLVKSKENDIIDQIEDWLPPAVFQELVHLKRKFDNAQKELESKISYTEEEEEALKRVFGDNAPKEFRKDLNLGALVKGLSYLYYKGYDVSQAEQNLFDSHQYSQLYPVYKDGIEYTIKCRSAKSGLLYLRASAWKELQNPNTFLYVWTGTSFLDAKFCKSREEVLSDLKADYQVVRLESKPSVSTLDSFLNGNLDPEDIWLIIRTKFKEEYRGIFEDIRKKSKTDSLHALSIGNEDED